MELTDKSHKTIKTKNYVKNNNLFFLSNGVNRKSNDWIIAEQELKKINFNYYKVFNKTAKKTFTYSIYKNASVMVNGNTFFIKPASSANPLSKNNLLNNFEPLLFSLLAVKLNNQIYSVKQLKNAYSLKYKRNKLIFYCFGLVQLKIFHKSPN